MPSKVSNPGIYYFDITVEFIFGIDMIIGFFEEYRDEEKMTLVTDLKKVAAHYLKTSWIFDMMALIPWTYMLPRKKEFTQFLCFFKLLRLKRMT